MKYSITDSSYKSRKVHIICFIILTFIVFLSEIFYKEPLFKYSLDVIPSFNHSNASNSFYYASNIAYIGSEDIQEQMMLLIVLFNTLGNIWSYFAIFTFTFFTQNLLKMLYSAPRPFVLLNELNPNCQEGHGNPSGNAMLATCLFLTTFEFINRSPLLHTYKGTRFAFLIFFGVLITIVIYCTFYIGEDSLDQLLFGFSLGILSWYFFFYVIEITSNEPETFFSQFEGVRNQLVFISVFIIMVTLSSGVFVLGLKQQDKEKLTVVVNKCSNSTELPDPLTADFARDQVTLGLLGAWIGMIIINSYMKNKFTTNADYMLYYFTQFLDKNFNLLFGYLILILTIIPYWIMKYQLYLPKDTSLQVKLLIRYVCPNFLVGILVTGFFPMILVWVGLIKYDHEILSKIVISHFNLNSYHNG